MIYLDCVWQLCQQYPSKFEFTETYLTSLWDTAHVSIFDTFIFNCERDRTVAAMVIVNHHLNKLLFIYLLYGIKIYFLGSKQSIGSQKCLGLARTVYRPRYPAVLQPVLQPERRRKVSQTPVQCLQPGTVDPVLLPMDSTAGNP